MADSSEPAAESPMAATPSARETALIALGQGALMVLGGVLALLIAQVFGKNAKTDAFFAAYGFYTVGLVFGQTFRLTAVSRLVHARGPETITRLLGAVVVMGLIAALPMVVLADPLGRLLVGADPGGVAATALRILWIVLVGQLLAAMLATILTVRGAFKVIGGAMLLAGFISIGTFLLLEGSLGIAAASVGLAASALWLMTVFASVLLRTGWRPTALTRRSLRSTCSETGRLLLGSATFIGTNVAYVSCIAIAARQGRGQATLFAYAYVIAVIFVSLTANVTAMVRSPAVVASSDRTKEAAAVGAWSFRFTVVLAGPVLGMTMLLGRPVIAFALGSGFGSADVRNILVTLLCLVGWILGSAAGIFAVVELLARGELRRLAVLAAIMAAVATGLGLAGGALAGIEGVATALSMAMLGMAAVQLRWAFGAAWRREAATMLRATLRELIVIAVAFAPPALLLAVLGETVVSAVAAALLAAALVAIASYVAWPRECGALLGLARRSPRRAAGVVPEDRVHGEPDGEPIDAVRAL
jgi:O-antigen/teichoic acid export membrane protein